MIVNAGDQNPAGETQDRTSLWARVKWTPQGRNDIESGRFKRLSPETSFHDRDAKTGLLSRAKALVASTLTNRPFFRELAAVAAALTDDDAALAALAARFNVEPAEILRIVNDPGGDTATTERTNMSDSLKALAASLGLAEDATETQITDAIAAKDAKIAELTAQADQQDTGKIAALEERVEAAEKKALNTERNALLDGAVRDRQIVPAQKLVLAEKFGANLDALRELLDTFPKGAVAARALGSGGDGKTGDLDVDTAPVTIQGTDYPVDEDGARVHAKALELLGKDSYTADEYVAAIGKAKRELAAA
jgi:phage I-like protein